MHLTWQTHKVCTCLLIQNNKMSQELLVELPSRDSHKEDLINSGQISPQHLDFAKPFKGPTKFTSQVDPVDFCENTIKAPTVNSQIKFERLSPPSGPPSGPSSVSEQRRKSRLIVVPTNPQQEEPHFEPLAKVDTLAQTKEPNLQPKKGGNFLKVVMAQSYFQRFVENLFLNTHFQRREDKEDLFISTLIDDLIYFYKKGRYQKNIFANLCRSFRFLPVFDQSSFLVITWQVLHILTILTILFWTPFNVAFGITFDLEVLPGVTVRNVEYYFLSTTVIDFLIVTNTSYIDKGVIIKSRRKIVLNYLQTQAIYDLLAFVSQLIALQFMDAESVANLGWSILPSTIFYLVRLLKLQVRVHKLEEFFNFTGWTQDFVELIKLLFMIIYVGHLFACLWHGVAFFYSASSGTWIEKYELLNEDNFTRYGYAFYWAAQTMITVGYGDMNPQNNLERWCCNVSMFLACGVFAFSFNSIGLMLSNLNSRQDLYKRSINLLNSFLIKNQIKTELQSRIRNYYDYIFQEEQEFNDEEVSAVTNKLSTTLQEELKIEIRMNFMMMGKVLSQFSTQILREISLQIEEVRFAPGEVIIKQNGLDDCALFIITKGSVNVMFLDEREERNNRLLGTFSKGQTFGEYSFFTGLTRSAAVRSVGFTRGYKLQRGQMLAILAHSQLDLEKFCQIKDNMLMYHNNEQARLRCFACQKATHLIKDCPLTHYVSDSELVLKRHLYPFTQLRDTPRQPRHSDPRVMNEPRHFRTLYERKHIEFQIREYLAMADYNQNVNIIDDEEDALGDEYNDDDEMDQDQDQENDHNYSASFSKSYSKVSRQHSQKNSLSQEHALAAIHESEDSAESQNNIRQRQRQGQVKQTISTAGFGGESLGNRLFNNLTQISQPNMNAHTNADQSEQSDQIQVVVTNSVREEEHKFSLKITENPSQIRTPQKKGTLLKQKREDSTLNYPSQNLIPYQLEGRERSNSQLRSRRKDDAVSPSMPLERKKQSVKSQRTRTAKTHKSTKLEGQIPSSHNQELVIPVNGRDCISMEFEDFERLKIYRSYFSWNNYTLVVQRAARTLKQLQQKRKVYPDFSVYTFNFYALSKAFRMRKRAKPQGIDETIADANNQIKKSVAAQKPQVRRGSKRQTQQDDQVLGLKRRPHFGTQIQQNTQSFKRFSKVDFQF